MADLQENVFPPDIQSRRQGLPPGNEHWNHVPHRSHTVPVEYDAPPYEEVEGAGHGIENSEIVCVSPPPPS